MPRVVHDEDGQAVSRALDTVYRWNSYFIAVGEVWWEKPKRGGYFYARIWRKGDPQLIIRCGHRHRDPGKAAECGINYVRTGKVSCEFGVD